MPDVNSVPLGEAGTGAAYILPQSQALAGFSNTLDQIQANNAKAAADKQAQAQRIAQAWKQNHVNIKGGTIFQPEINARSNKVMSMGMDLQRQGVDPTGYSNDPKTQQLLSAYQQEKASLISDAQTRDEIAKSALEAHKEYAKQPDGYYDPQSIADINDYTSGTGKYGSLSNIVANGHQMPELKRSYDLNAAVDKLPVTPIETTSTLNGIKTKLVLPNEAAHQQTAHDFVINTPEARAAVEKQIGVPLSDLPDSTDPNKIKTELDAMYRSRPAIPSLAAQGIQTYGAFGQNNSQGVTDQNSQGAAVNQPGSGKYNDFITQQAKQLAGARQKYDQIIGNIKGTLDNKVHKVNDQSYDFAYQREMRDRQHMGMETTKFNQWLKDQQNEAGETTLGNAGGFVPVVGQTQSNIDGGYPTDSQGKVIPGPVTLQPGASLFTTKLPSVDVTLQPNTITSFDNKTGGRTYKNAEPISMKVSGIKMVPVWKGTDDNDPQRNKELSAIQLNDVLNNKWPGKAPGDVVYKPMVYGLQDKKDDKGHGIVTPISIPYEDFRGGSTKKVNTKAFDNYYQDFQNLSKNPKFIALTPQQKAEFISQRYSQQSPQ